MMLGFRRPKQTAVTVSWN